jgi:hypothetical protein
MANAFQFSDERFLSADEKSKVLHAWKRFLESGCEKTRFTEALYHHLIQHCCFIAHYDRHGFYDFYFGRIEGDLFRFLDQFDPEKPGISAESGMTYWLDSHNTGSDLNRAMRETAGPYLRILRQRFEEIRRQADIGAARQLLARYGLVVTEASPGVQAANDAEKPPRDHAVAEPIQAQLFAE